MRRLIALITVLVASTLWLGVASAQVIGIGTQGRGATAQVAAGIARIVSLYSDVNMRTQTVASTAQYLPMVNSGKLAFGVSNIAQLTYAYHGTGLSKGKPHKNLRLIAGLFSFRNGLIVRQSSGIESIANLKGKRLSAGFSSTPLARYLHSAMLATGGLTYDDVIKVPVANWPGMYNAFWEGDGRVVAATGVVGAGIIERADSKVGGVNFVSLAHTPEAVKAARKYIPTADIKLVPQNSKIAGIRDKGVYVLHFSYTAWANKDVYDEVAYKVAKAMYDNGKELSQSSPLWNSFSREQMPRDFGIPFHPGAKKFFQEMNIWKR